MVNKFKKKEGNVMEMFCLQLLYYVFPENIQAHITEGIGNSGGVGDSKA